MSRFKMLYGVISRRLIKASVITREESDIICRKGHRKGRYWRRHLLDLCGYSIEKMNRHESGNSILKKLCETGKKVAMNETQVH